MFYKSFYCQLVLNFISPLSELKTITLLTRDLKVAGKQHTSLFFGHSYRFCQSHCFNKWTLTEVTGPVPSR